MGPKESEIQRLILDWLAARQYYAWRNYVGAVIRKDAIFSKNPAKGMPDIMGLFKDGSGRLFAIEVKADRGRVSPEQKERIKALNAGGAVAFVAKSLEDVIRMLAMEELPSALH